jgi:hypothetical protein
MTTTTPPPPPAAIRTTERRAETLLADGYKLEATDTPGIYWMARPTPLVNKKTGEVTEGYWIDLMDGCACSCRLYEVHGRCKHSIAAFEELRGAIQLLMPLLRDRQLLGSAARTLEVTA